MADLIWLFQIMKNMKRNTAIQKRIIIYMGIILMTKTHQQSGIRLYRTIKDAIAFRDSWINNL